MTGCWEGSPQRVVQRFEILPHEKVLYAQSGILPREWDAHTSLGFWNTNGSPNHGQTNRLTDSQQKNRNCRIVVFNIPADHRIKLKEGENRDRYLDLAIESRTSNRTWRWRWYQQ